MRTYQQLKQLSQLAEKEILVRHIATYDLYAPEPHDDAETVREKMEEPQIDVAPIGEGSTYHSYVEAKEHDKGPCREYALPISDATDVVDERTPVAEVFQALYERHHLFVRQDHNIEGIVTKSDLQRVPVRILVFGLVTLLEMNLRASVAEWHGMEK